MEVLLHLKRPRTGSTWAVKANLVKGQIPITKTLLDILKGGWVIASSDPKSIIGEAEHEVKIVFVRGNSQCSLPGSYANHEISFDVKQYKRLMAAGWKIHCTVPLTFRKVDA